MFCLRTLGSASSRPTVLMTSRNLWHRAPQQGFFGSILLNNLAAGSILHKLLAVASIHRHTISVRCCNTSSRQAKKRRTWRLLSKTSWLLVRWLDTSKVSFHQSLTPPPATFLRSKQRGSRHCARCDPVLLSYADDLSKEPCLQWICCNAAGQTCQTLAINMHPSR